MLAQYQSGAQTRRVAALRRAAPDAFVELHPDLAARLGIDDGEPVRVATRRGELRGAGPAQRRRSGRTPSSCRSTGPGRPAPTRLTNDALDPISRMPEFKVCAVRVERA